MTRLLWILLVISSNYAIGQSSEESLIDSLEWYDVDLQTDLSFFVGVSNNFSNGFMADLGVGINQYGSVGFHAHAVALVLSTEFSLNQKNDLIFGPKLSTWIAGGVGGMAMGINFIYYKGPNDQSLVFRPEVGFGMGRYKLVYGYNLPFKKNNDLDLARHHLTFAYLIKVWKMKETKRNWPK